MGGIGKTLRPIKRGKSNVPGLVKILVWTLDQFTADADWPKRSDITDGQITVVPPLLTTEKAARVFFDIETGARIKVEGGGDSTNMTFHHSLEDVAISGHEGELEGALDKVYNMPCLIVGIESDGKRTVIGSTTKPVLITSDFDSGAVSGDKFRGTKLKAKTINPLDFRPPVLGTAVVIAEETITAQT